MLRVVFDTSLLVAASRSRRGASFALVSKIPSDRFQICLSVALFAEWQAAVCRPQNRPAGASEQDALGFVRYLAGQSHLQEIYFSWRPCLPDADDDMVLELAVAAGCRAIVTHNVQDFVGAERFGVKVLSPAEFLESVGKEMS